jgi:secondary thiamine-phosphate synthase enzyme
MERINIKTSRRIELVDITDKVQAVVGKSKVKQGVCLLYVPHTTAGLTINENADPSVKRDIATTLTEMVPEDAGYAHMEGNADSHIKSSLLGSSLTIFVEEGRLALGRWQGIFFAEGDGPRSREVWVKLITSTEG